MFQYLIILRPRQIEFLYKRRNHKLNRCFYNSSNNCIQAAGCRHPRPGRMIVPPRPWPCIFLKQLAITAMVYIHYFNQLYVSWYPWCCCWWNSSIAWLVYSATAPQTRSTVDITLLPHQSKRRVFGLPLHHDCCINYSINYDYCMQLTYVFIIK